MKLSVVIPNFNGQKLLEKNLPIILSEIRNIEIVIVDDASTDESVNFLKKNYPQIKLIEKVTNTGFATTVNLGFKAASGNIVILLNSDVLPKKDFLKPLLTHFDDNSVFAVGCLDESWENGHKVKRGRGIGSFKRGFLNHQRGEINATHTLWVNGGSGAFRKSIWESLGGFDYMYEPFYWEDIDLSFRAQKLGYQVLFENKSVVEHLHDKGAIKTGFSANLIKEIAYRNQFIFVWKNITSTNLLFLHLIWLPYNLVMALIRFDSAFYKGFALALLKLNQIIKKRTIMAKMNIKTDEAILDNNSL